MVNCGGGQHARWAFAAFTWLYPLLGTALCNAALYAASYPAFLHVQDALRGARGVDAGAAFERRRER